MIHKMIKNNFGRFFEKSPYLCHWNNPSSLCVSIDFLSTDFKSISNQNSNIFTKFNFILKMLNEQDVKDFMEITKVSSENVAKFWIESSDNLEVRIS